MNNRISLVTALFAVVFGASVAQSFGQPPVPNRGVAGVRGAGVEYVRYYNEKECEGTIKGAANSEWCMVEFGDSETLYVNLTDSLYFAEAFAGTVQSILSEEVSLRSRGLELVEREAAVICSWECDKYRVRSSSEDIVLYVTPNLGYTITPVPSYGIPNGIVMRVEKDGETVLEATKTTRTIHTPEIEPAITETAAANRLPMRAYRHKIIQTQSTK
ncbi:MAG: hypothetical protein R3Y61_04095 [Rikenellaceae bacterium]